MSANIEHLRAVGRAATEGPWEVEPEPTSYAAYDGHVRTAHPDFHDCADEVAKTVDHADAEFCATARNEWDGLLDEVEALRAKLARVEALAEECKRTVHGRLGLADRLRAALADESAQDALSRPGTTSVASGAAGDVTGAQIGAQDEGGKA